MGESMTPDITGTDTGVDSEGTAFGLAQRRSWVFSAWWYPAVLSVSGAVQAGLALAVGQSAQAGIVLASLGAVSAALGWALTAGQRFTRRPPKPGSDIPRERAGGPGATKIIDSSHQLDSICQWFTNRENAFRFAFGPPGISPAGLHTSSGRSAVPG